MSAATIDLASLADALEADIVPFRTPSGTLLVSVDGGDTAIGPTGKRVPVHSAWDEVDDDIAVDVLAAPQVDALAGLARMREHARAAASAIAERRAANAPAPDECTHSDLVADIFALARLLSRIR